MKKLLLTWIFSGSLDGFSQTTPAVCYHNTPACTCVTGTVVRADALKPDTLRATLIVYYDRGPAIVHTKPGYVLFGGGEPVYLDDKKVRIKAPLEVLTYKLKR